jgi:superfamily I DNA/RNA helicase
LEILDQEIQSGVMVQQIAFVSFTRKAVKEAISRTCEKFGFEKADLLNFKTIHALAYREMGVKQNELVSTANMDEFSSVMQMPFSANMDDATGLASGASIGDEMLFYSSLARVKREDLDRVYHNLVNPNFTWHMFKQISKAYQQYRMDAGVLDFTDILERYASFGDPISCKVAFIDEAQDLSRLQWEVLAVAFMTCERIYIAGDDDQAIYSWSGADIQTFLRLQGDKEVLGISHRMPKEIFNLSQKIIQQISDRYEKKVLPRNENGNIDYHNSPESIAIDATEQTWMMLVRNTYALNNIESHLKVMGIPYIKRHGGSSVQTNHLTAIRCWEKLRKGQEQPGFAIRKVYDQLKVGHGVKRGFKSLKALEDELSYSMADLKQHFGLMTDLIWHDAFKAMPMDDVEYYLSILRVYGSTGLTQQPKVHVNTIHGVKGGEADNVVLYLDQARKTHQEYLANPDAERRVMYVGVTRAKQHLHIVQPQTNKFFLLPT